MLRPLQLGSEEDQGHAQQEVVVVGRRGQQKHEHEAVGQGLVVLQAADEGQGGQEQEQGHDGAGRAHEQTWVLRARLRERPQGDAARETRFGNGAKAEIPVAGVRIVRKNLEVPLVPDRCRAEIRTRSQEHQGHGRSADAEKSQQLSIDVAVPDEPHKEEYGRPDQQKAWKDTRQDCPAQQDTGDLVVALLDQAHGQYRSHGEIGTQESALEVAP